jgi:hypothetical protein
MRTTSRKAEFLGSEAGKTCLSRYPSSAQLKLRGFRMKILKIFLEN